MIDVIEARDWTSRTISGEGVLVRIRRSRIPAIWLRLARTAPPRHRIRGALAIAPSMLGWLWSPPRFLARLEGQS